MLTKFTNEYKIDNSVIKVSDLSLIEPVIAIDKNGNYLKMSKFSAKQINQIYNLGGYQFSNKLYWLDVDSWRSLRDKRLTEDNIIENINKYNAVVVNDVIVTVVEDKPYVAEILDFINEFVRDDDISTYVEDIEDKRILSVICIKDNKTGINIRYYIEDNWISIDDCYYDEDSDTLLFGYSSEISSYINEDIINTINKDDLMQSAELSIAYAVEDIKNSFSVHTSVDEFSYYMKRLFKIKLGVAKYDIMNYAADHQDIPVDAINELSSLIDKYYDNASSNYTLSSYLRKAITMSSITYGEFVNSLSKIYIHDDLLKIDDLVGIERKVLNKSTDYDQLNS